MSDLIDRQTAIDAIGDVHPLDYNAIAIRDRIKALPSANQWIPCSERFPEIDGTYLVTGKSKYSPENDKWFYFTDIACSHGKYIDDFWDTFNDWVEGQEIHIIAWMPLPDPWEGVEDE